MKLLALYKGYYYKLIIVRNKWYLVTHRDKKKDESFTWREEDHVYLKEINPFDSNITDIREYHCEVHYEEENYPLFRKLFQVDGTIAGPFEASLESKLKLKQNFVCINSPILKDEAFSPKWVQLPKKNIMTQMIDLNDCKACYISSRTFYIKGVETYPPRTKYRKVSIEEFMNMLGEIMFP